MLDRISDYVEQYYSRARHLVAHEAVTLQPLNRDLTANGFSRRLEYELRLEWTPTSAGEGTAQIVRKLLRVNGRDPRARDEPRCLDPRALSPEPLSVLLPDKRGRYVFSPAGLGAVSGRTAVMIDYVPAARDEPKVEWSEDCVSADVPGYTRGRVWADPETAEVLRFDERLTGPVDIRVPRAMQRTWGPLYLTIQRADTSIRYARVTFHDPDETLMLPSVIDTVVVFGGSYRMSQVLTNYRRFVTGSRIVQ
jgi:hypothetical protein